MTLFSCERLIHCCAWEDTGSYFNYVAFSTSLTPPPPPLDPLHSKMLQRCGTLHPQIIHCMQVIISLLQKYIANFYEKNYVPPTEGEGVCYCFCSGCRRHQLLAALCLLNQWVDFDQTGTDTLLRRGKEVIRFWWPWPHFQGTPALFNIRFVGVCIASCLHCVFWTNGWILTKLAQTHYWDGGKKWLDFGDFDLIFKVHQHLLISNLLASA